jgi:hypothetical protein
MATTALSGTTNPDPAYYSTTGTELTMTAADVANGNHIVAAFNIILVAHNTGGSAYTVTITSAADANTGRTGDVSAQSLAADEIRYFWLTPDGWNDANGQYLVSANNAAVELGWFRQAT